MIVSVGVSLQEFDERLIETVGLLAVGADVVTLGSVL